MIIPPQTHSWSASKAVKPLEKEDQPPPPAKWGVLVYFASDNDLYKFQSKNLRDLEKVGSSPEMHIVAQMDHGPEKGNTLRYYITRSEVPSSIQSPIIGDLGKDVDSADPKVLKDFIASSVKSYPAEHYLLVLNGPGAGFSGGLPDQGSGKKMSLPQMREALEEAQKETGKRLDIIGFDSSLMAQAEVAYELRGAGDILLGSEEYEWGPGWQYDHIFGAKTLAEVQAILGKKKDMSPEELARKIVSEQEAHQDYIPTFSASRLSEMGGLKEASNTLAKAILGVQSPEEKDVIRRTIANVQHYGGDIAPFKDYRDLGHLARLISRTEGISHPVKEAAQLVEGALHDTVIATQATNDGYDDSTGLSVYLPYTKGNQDYGYAGTLWARDTLWDEALESLARVREGGTISVSSDSHVFSPKVESGASPPLPPLPPPPSRGRSGGGNPSAGVFADPFGKITHLALQFDSIARGPIRENVMDTWATLIKTMDPDVHFTIVLEKETDLQTAQKLLSSHKFSNPERFHFIMCNDINITMWSRDQMVGLFGPTDDSVLLAQTTMRPHGQDPLIPPRIVAANKGIVLDPDKRLVTDGGDEVSNRRETFLGYTSLYLTAQHLHDISGAKTSFKDGQNTWLEKARALFEEKYGKPVTVIGADDPTTPEIERPATFHIDMGLTPVDDNTILVGDPREAIKIIRRLPKKEYEAYNKRLREVLKESGDVMQRLMDANTIHDPLLQHQFDHNAELLAEKGYNIIRVPYLQGPPGVSWVTYNNCLMETYQKEDGTQVRRAFLPNYGLPALDNAARTIYESQGFQVVPLDLAALTSWKGAIRCISNILGKKPEA